MGSDSSSADVFLGVLSGGAAGYAVAKWLEKEKEKRDKRNKKMVAKITKKQQQKEQQYTTPSSHSSNIAAEHPPYHAPVGLNVDYPPPHPQYHHEGATAHVQRYLKELPQRFHAAEAAWHRPWVPVQHPGDHVTQPAYDHWGNPVQPQHMHRSSSRPARPPPMAPGHPPHLSCGSSPLCSYNEGFR